MCQYYFENIFKKIKKIILKYFYSLKFYGVIAIAILLPPLKMAM